MISKATLRYLRITPRKFRLIIPIVKGKNAEEAVAILMSVKKGASKYAIDLLKSAIANAKHKQQGLDTSTLYISNFIANHGPMLKRYRAASMGRAGEIRKHMSHVTIELDVAKKLETHDAQTKHAAGQHGQKSEVRSQKSENRVHKSEKMAVVKKDKVKEAPKKETHKKDKE